MAKIEKRTRNEVLSIITDNGGTISISVPDAGNFLSLDVNKINYDTGDIELVQIFPSVEDVEILIFALRTATKMLKRRNEDS